MSRFLRISVFVFLVLGGQVMASLPADAIVAYTSDDGKELLCCSRNKGDFWRLSRYFITQQNGGFCSVASSVMALNALEIEKPEVPNFKNYRLFTQDNFFTDEVRQFLTPEHVRRHGMNLEELQQVIETFGVEATVRHGEDLDEGQLRSILLDVLNDPQKILLSEYHRQKLDQVGVGHFSPIAAYNESSDRVLIMDVSRYKYPPIWVKLDTFLESIRGGDSEGNPLGLVIITRIFYADNCTGAFQVLPNVA